jgi:hypothetical protein
MSSSITALDFTESHNKSQDNPAIHQGLSSNAQMSDAGSPIRGGMGGDFPPQNSNSFCQKIFSILLRFFLLKKIFSDLTSRSFLAENLLLCLFISTARFKYSRSFIFWQKIYCRVYFFLQQDLNTVVLSFFGRKSTAVFIYFYSKI